MRWLGASTTLVTVIAGGVLGLPYSAAAAAATCHGHTATLVGTEGDDTLDGTSGKDVIVGLGGNDTISGRGGVDVICGGDGSDTVAGGSGRDRLYGGRDRLGVGEDRTHYGDTLEGGAGNDLLDLGWDARQQSWDWETRPETVSFADSTHGVHVDLVKGTATGDGRDTIVLHHTLAYGYAGIVGSDHDDVIVTGSTSDNVQPGRGDDLVHTGDNRDTVLAETPLSANGTDHIVTGGGNDLVATTSGPDRVATGTGDDVLSVAGLGQSIVTGPGSDRVGQAGAWKGMTVDTGSGPDVVRLNAPFAGSHVDGGPGADHVWVTNTAPDLPVGLHLAEGSVVDGSSVLRFTSVKAFTVRALDGDITFSGRSGPDRLDLTTTGSVSGYLGAGDDVLRVVSPDVTANLGGGDDTFTFSRGRGAITLDLGPGDDSATTNRNRTPYLARSVDGGPGTDVTHLDGGANTCMRVEKGTCPA